MPFVKGDPRINREGRPKGKTIKEMVREWLEEHPDDMEAFVKHFVKKNKELAWQMLEGRPPQDITSGGEKINPIPIIDVSANFGDKKDNPDVPEDKNSTRGNQRQQDSINNNLSDSSGTE